MSQQKSITRTRAGSFSEWYASGQPWVWFTGGAVALSGLMVVGLLALIAIRGLGHFWPAPIIEAVYVEPGEAPRPLIAQLGYSETVSTARLQSAGIPVDGDQEFYERRLVKVANRDVYGADFRYLLDDWIQQRTTPETLSVFERLEWGWSPFFEFRVKSLPPLCGNVRWVVAKIAQKAFNVAKTLTADNKGRFCTHVAEYSPVI